MGLFGNKQPDDQAAEEALSSEVLADNQYREELKQVGREQFKELVAQQADHLDGEISAMVEQVASDVKMYATKRVDDLIGRLNSEITDQINERLKDYNRVSGESQELVAQSLTQNAQMVHEKFQQLSMNLQQVVANQEVLMATVFQDGKTQAAAVQAEQSKILDQLRQNEERTRQEAEGLSASMRQVVTAQATQLGAVYQENLASVEATKETQTGMLETLKRTTEKIEQQHEELSQLLDNSIANQKAMVVDVINENMSRIVEHYLIGALGEQTTLREQLPSILQNMEENKQAMVDDMKL